MCVGRLLGASGIDNVDELAGCVEHRKSAEDGLVGHRLKLGCAGVDRSGLVGHQRKHDSRTEQGCDPVAHVHTQNGLGESFIKRLQLIAKPLLIRAKRPLSVWGHAILHVASLIRIRSTSYHKYSPV
ncbi:Retrovirus-related Pol polyprotein from transposon TNT 1-94 [Cucumis melo var. makuwa]|uniref:Retrovirus-related Pol polyprotein from transposon TNT 1-94 n=1 Tax=Cucumis melo var. makuwa TaxID=1194695 RepID=A0A5A7TXY7_CUCMM|nr:Retrovirus-related Pol polyprotein from transposon TNT 1-94 [Cucumis melo var. makuwa]